MNFLKTIDSWVQARVNALAFFFMRTFGVDRSFMVFFTTIVLLGLEIVHILLRKEVTTFVIPIIGLVAFSVATMKLERNRPADTLGILDRMAGHPAVGLMKFSISAVFFMLLALQFHPDWETHMWLDVGKTVLMEMFCYMLGIPPKAPKKSEKKAPLSSFVQSLGF